MDLFANTSHMITHTSAANIIYSPPVNERLCKCLLWPRLKLDFFTQCLADKEFKGDLLSVVNWTHEQMPLDAIFLIEFPELNWFMGKQFIIFCQTYPKFMCSQIHYWPTWSAVYYIHNTSSTGESFLSILRGCMLGAIIESQFLKTMGPVS